jgi:hypothetical protein
VRVGRLGLAERFNGWKAILNNRTVQDGDGMAAR